MLIEVRNGANRTLIEWAIESTGAEHDAKVEDARDVWHAADMVLGILMPGKYVPKREAMNDVRALLRWYDDIDTDDEEADDGG